LCKFFAIKAQDGLAHPLKNVLTAKMGLFLGVLEEKQGVRALKKHFILGFFGFWGVSCLASRCLSAPSITLTPPKKIVPENLR
jgi:hypothetical protein